MLYDNLKERVPDAPSIESLLFVVSQLPQPWPWNSVSAAEPTKRVQCVRCGMAFDSPFRFGGVRRLCHDCYKC